MSATSDTPSAAGPDYSTWDTARLISRITELEQQLSSSTENQPRGRSKPTNDLPPTSPLINPGDSYPPGPLTPSRSSSRAARPARDIDPSKYNTRFIALKFAYLGQRYNGYEHANGNITPLPTIEEELFKALRKSRLIFPKTVENVDNVDRAGNRLLRPYSIDWEGCDYSKCGRTDRGVSAFGQVVGVRVRSAKPKKKKDVEPVKTPDIPSSVTPVESPLGGLDIDVCDLEAEEAWDDIADELPYIQMLNGVLPEDIRILAWCPHPPPGFDARFSCRERRYRYFFTQPAFCPTPGPFGFLKRPGDTSGAKMREGWLDIDAMREGAKRFIGSHDFRNFCKVDASKQITNFVRKISHADIQVLDASKLPPAFLAQQGFQQFEHLGQQERAASGGHNAALKVYYFSVHGSAFLWHQVRHMVGILFLIGQGLEPPSIVSELLDVSKNPRRPTYEIASDAPLVLWDCVFPGPKSEEEGRDGLDWVYAGDPRTARSGRSDGKFGQGGAVDEVWSVWRQRKIDEVLAASLLDLVVSQGESSSIARGGFRQPTQDIFNRSQKMFYGGNDGKLSGKYVPLMQRRRNDTVEEINARWTRKGKRVAKNGADKTHSADVEDAA
ncbi:pseudouridylate synthase, putative [Coccidioides posadasii C735 delta SOWgp]|uniref:Pseudouridylate synthase, putative n=1 Tax=Coccidioides posadasii (strain C735) TaxID=222929 RepID=C5PA07_COCP7|nr:pseudouridylate synthase, putative [Coccidioides posadasii C735 delta SOWgp]EER26569.1 pseudouridylate synthase, putative [Coccidioides posadasii C735 delta SOWgp]|eukprot:XP_003068714.1 pseudouridylate synthase, putative [Coccidioides posadasii C735 delta SOWgp]